jgi:hypothetical protein
MKSKGIGSLNFGPPMFLIRNSLSDQRLLMNALVVVCCVRLGLWLMPLGELTKIAKKIAPRFADSGRPQIPNFQLTKKVCSSVRRVSRYVPSASCLTQALATQVLLARRGQVSTLQIGVKKGDEDQLKAHAWVESNGRIIIGGTKDLGKYTVLNRSEKVGH